VKAVGLFNDQVEKDELSSDLFRNPLSRAILAVGPSESKKPLAP
jgi:hypothetical protein